MNDLNVEQVAAGRWSVNEDTFRVEEGPARVVNIASAGLFNSGVIPSRYKVGGPDADGNIIKIGEEFTYLDTQKASHPSVFYLYKYDQQEQKFINFGIADSHKRALDKITRFLEASN